mgnify:CR=1 FL=1
MKKFLFLIMVVLLAGCAVGNKYDYRSSAIDLSVKSSENKKILLSVEDLRPYVVNGSKPPNFVGLQRGGFGNPFGVTTSSQEPLATDMAIAIKNALSDVGYEVTNIKEAAPNREYLVNLAAENGANRIVELKINEWKSDVFMSITLHCDLALTVFDPNGDVLATNRMKFEEAIGGAKIGASKNSQAVTAEFSKRIGYLFNKKEVRDSL